MISHLEDNLQDREDPNTSYTWSTPSGPAAEEERWRKELTLMVINLVVVRQVVRFRMDQRRTYTNLERITLEVSELLMLAPAILQEEKVAHQ
jgi:hypothetical protein